MALVTGTTSTYASVGLREDLLNAIYLIDPHDTPFMSNAGRGKTKAIKHEWQIDNLAAADGANAQLDGDDYAFTVRAATTRVADYTQISRKPVLISRTLEAVDKAGRDSEVKYQVVKAGMELKRDQETILASNQASFAGAVGTARKLGGFGSWLTSNVSRGATGANGGFNTGTGLTVAPTAGTARAFIETYVQDVQQAAYNNGGNPKILMMSPKQKRVASAFAGIAVNRIENERETTGQLTIFGGADIYQGNFGVLSFVPNRWMPTTNAYLMDTKFVSVDYLRPTFVDKVANTGDAEKRMVLVEYTLTVKNQQAHGVVDDLN